MDIKNLQESEKKSCAKQEQVSMYSHSSSPESLSKSGCLHIQQGGPCCRRFAFFRTGRENSMAQLSRTSAFLVNGHCRSAYKSMQLFVLMHTELSSKSVPSKMDFPGRSTRFLQTIRKPLPTLVVAPTASLSGLRFFSLSQDILTNHATSPILCTHATVCSLDTG
jgi:hypothetical protein